MGIFDIIGPVMIGPSSSPTAGGCGVLPAAIFTVAGARHADDEAVLRVMFIAGGIGLVIEKLASLCVTARLTFHLPARPEGKHPRPFELPEMAAHSDGAEPGYGPFRIL